MIDLQQAFVADHIASLEREAAALRAERTRDHVRAHVATGATATDEPIDHPTTLISRRARLGRWLVAIGEAISGPAPVDGRRQRLEDPCADPSDRLRHAA